MNNYKQGLKHGIPICLGYLSVSFTFGLLAVSEGLSWWQATLISMTNVTSAGQFAGLTIMLSAGPYVEMLITEFFINLRYLLMSISLSQKVDARFKSGSRAILAMGVTDEIFAVSMAQPKAVSRSYFAGLFTGPYLGWTLGTLTGALLGEIIPRSVADIFGIAIYGMFLAIIIPPAKHNKAILEIILIAIAMSCIFTYVPFVNLSAGVSITLCAVVAAGIGAWRHPLPEEKEEEA